MADKEKDKSNSPSNSNAKKTKNKNTERQDIDSKLEERASTTNMSVVNVKSMLHHILKDKRVVAMAKKLAEDDDSADSDIEIAPFEPRLTRSRVREAVNFSVNDGNLSPEKLSSFPLPSSVNSKRVTNNVLDSIFPLEEEDEDDEDEEYTPGGDTSNINEETLIDSEFDDKETEEEEKEENEHMFSSPTHKQSLTEAYDHERAAIEAASLLASLSDVNFTPVKSGGLSLFPPSLSSPPSLLLSSSSNNQETQSEIAHRTRSKLPLVDTDIHDIEASFNPPDLPSDDEEAPPTSSGGTQQELDEEELEWQRWLADLMNPHCIPVQDDAEDDTEYNFWAENNQDYEKEEFRNDRGVKIPQREVDELIEELLNPSSGLFNTDIITYPNTSTAAAAVNSVYSSSNINTSGGSGGVGDTDLTSAYLLESLGLRPPILSHGQLISSHSNKRRDNTTTSLMATTSTIPPPSSLSPSRSQQQENREEEKEKDEVEEEKTCFLTKDQSLQVWDQIQQHFQLLMQTFIMTRFEPNLVFLSQLSSKAIEEIGKWCKEPAEGRNTNLWYIPGLEESLQLVSKYMYNPNKKTEVDLVASSGNPPKIPDVVKDIIMTNGIFWNYPQYLPEIGPAPIDSSQSAKYFTTSEDYLLVLGMDHYGSTAWKVIQEKLLPTKTTKQLHVRVKNLSSARTKQDNVIKHYKRTGQIVIPFESSNVSSIITTPSTPPISSSSTEQLEDIRLPDWIIRYHNQRIEMEEKERVKREKHLKELQKIATTYNLSSSPTTPSSSSLERGTKRNLTNNDDAIEMDSAKRSKVDVVKGKRGRKRKPSPDIVGPFKDTYGIPKHKNPEADYQQLLYMAGLEGSDPAARYAFNYLTEVKATVMDEPNTYKTFIKLLMEARKKDWSPGKLYMEVQPILKRWPHLLKLFMAFLNPKDAIMANVIADKIDFEQVKAFIKKLQDKYSGNPFELDMILSKLKNLDSQDSSVREKIMSELMILLKRQEDLLYDLRHFVTGVLPAKKIAASEHDDFEEIVLPSNNTHLVNSKDDYEEVVMPDNWASQNYSSSHHPTATTNTTTATTNTTTTNTLPCSSLMSSHNPSFHMKDNSSSNYSEV